VIRSYHEEIERDQRLPKALVEQLHAAGFYRLVIPRELGGLQVDPLTYLRVVELLAEGAGSVGWNLANNSIGHSSRSGCRTRASRRSMRRCRHRHCRHRRAGGWAGGAGRWWLPRQRPLALWQRLSGELLDARELPDSRRRPAAPQPRRYLGLLARGIPRSEAQVVEGAGMCPGCAAPQLRLDGRGRLPAGAADDAPRRRAAWTTNEALARITYALPAQAWVGPHHSAVITGIARAGIDALIQLSGGKHRVAAPLAL